MSTFDIVAVADDEDDIAYLQKVRQSYEDACFENAELLVSGTSSA